MRQNHTIRVRQMLVAGTLAFSLVLGACHKNKDSTTVTPSPTTTANTITDDDVADAVDQAVTMNNSGIAEQTEEVATYARTTTTPCGGTKDTSLAASGTLGASITYDYSYLCHTAVTCTLGVPTKFTGTLTGYAKYTTARMRSDDSCRGDVEVTGLAPTATNYTVNFTFTRNGYQASKVRKMTEFTSVITITGTDIVVNKTTSAIMSGTAAVTVTGTVTGGSTFTRTGTLTFTGSRTATLTLSSGSSFSLSW